MRSTHVTMQKWRIRMAPCHIMQIEASFTASHWTGPTFLFQDPILKFSSSSIGTLLVDGCHLFFSREMWRWRKMGERRRWWRNEVRLNEVDPFRISHTHFQSWCLLPLGESESDDTTSSCWGLLQQNDNQSMNIGNGVHLFCP